MASIKKVINSTTFKVFLLFVIAFLPRIINLGGHVVFVDEITWMSRAKDVYAAVRTMTWSQYNVKWWLITTTTEAIGLPVTFLSGIAMTYLSPGYSVHSLNITTDYIAARLPVVLIGTFFIPIFYLLLKKFINDKLAFVTSLLLAIDPIAIALSRWVQHDTALMAFSSLSLLLYLISKRKINVVLSAFLASMAILPPERTLFVAIYMILICFVAFSLVIVSYIKPDSKFIWVIVFINLIASLLLIKSVVTHWSGVYTEVKSYAVTWDSEEKNLMTEIKNGSEPTLKNIHPVGELDSFTDNKGWVASCVAGYFKLQNVKITE